MLQIKQRPSEEESLSFFQTPICKSVLPATVFIFLPITEREPFLPLRLVATSEPGAPSPSCQNFSIAGITSFSYLVNFFFSTGSYLLAFKQAQEGLTSLCLLSVRLLATPWTAAYRLFCPWDFLGKSTGVGCHFLLHGTSRPRDQTQVSHTVDRCFTV